MKAVIMAGGQGTRFWPVSREDSPKQFLSVSGGRSLLQETVTRLQPLLEPQDVYVVCGQKYVDKVQAQLQELRSDQIIAEPVPRNTAPCIGLAAIYLRERFPDAVMAVLPSDHVIQEVAEFQRALQVAEHFARQGWLMTFGIEPSYPATGFGYLHRGEKIDEHAGKQAHRVKQFTEKPDRKRARDFLQSGDYYWNSGMFVWSVADILSAIQLYMPGLYEGLLEIQQRWNDPAQVKEVFSRLENTSIDFGVMEKASRVAMLPCRLGWSDVGNWKALAEILSKDAEPVTANGPYVAIDSKECVVYSSNGKMVALVGVEGLIVVSTPDALLVCNRERTEEVKKVVEQLKAKGLTRYL